MKPNLMPAMMSLAILACVFVCMLAWKTFPPEPLEIPAKVGPPVIVSSVSQDEANQAMVQYMMQYVQWLTNCPTNYWTYPANKLWDVPDELPDDLAALKHPPSIYPLRGDDHVEDGDPELSHSLPRLCQCGSMPPA
jgi:hypothetical protein